MSTYPEIFSVRLQLDSIRQPSFRDSLLGLREKLNGSTPYDRTREIRGVLMSFALFSTGARGKQISPPAQPFLYRFCKLPDIVKFTDWKGDREQALKLLFEDVKIKSKTTGDPDGWFSLAEVARGSLTSERHFTWWSSSPVRKGSIICDLHERGMTNERIIPFSILLRCSTSQLSRFVCTFQPSALDGFDSVIFDAQSEDIDDCGYAISVEDPMHLKKGVDEYALKPVPVDVIEALPLHVRLREKDHKIYEEDILASLKTYYLSSLKL
jgi:hypothetical protein